MVRFFPLILLFLSLPTFATAQTINAEESATPYSNVAGWSVFTMSDGRGVNSCRAVWGNGYGDQIMIDYGLGGSGQDWTLYVQANRTPNDEGFGVRGAGLYFNTQYFADAQIGFGVLGNDGASSTHAQLILTPDALRRFQSSQSIGLSINGEASRTWSLTGSSAAVRQVEACQRGDVSTATPQPQLAPANPPLRSTQPTQPQVQTQQTFNAPMSGELIYAQNVRGWTVFAGRDERGGVYCTAQTNQGGSALRIGYAVTAPVTSNTGYSSPWIVGVPHDSDLPPFFGIVLDGIGDSITTAPTLRGWMGGPIAGQFIDSIAQGSRMNVDVGYAYYQFSLFGSAAAILKIRECVQRIR